MLKVKVRFGSNQTDVDIPNLNEGSTNDAAAAECVERLRHAWAGIVDAKNSWTVEFQGATRVFTFTAVGGTKA